MKIFILSILFLSSLNLYSEEYEIKLPSEEAYIEYNNIIEVENDFTFHKHECNKYKCKHCGKCMCHCTCGHPVPLETWIPILPFIGYIFYKRKKY